MRAQRELHLRRSKATTIFLFAGGLLLAYLCYQLARPFLSAIAWATILAVIFAPLHRKLQERLKRDNLSALASTSITLLLGVLPLVLFISAVTQEAAQGYQLIHNRISSGVSLTEQIGQIQGLGPVVERLQSQLKQWGLDLNALAGQAAQYLGEFAVTLAKGTISNLSAFLLNVVLTTFTLFFFFRDGSQIFSYFQRIIPLESGRAGGMYQLIGQIIRAAIYGVVVISLIKGALAGLAFWVLGVHSPILWGAVGAIASVIPVFGIGLVWVPAALILLVQGHTIKALILTIWGVTALSLIDNFLYPILVRNQVRLHTLVVFFSTLGGLGVFGLLGFVLGPVVATLTLALIEIASEYYADRTQILTAESTPDTTDIAQSNYGEQS